MTNRRSTRPGFTLIELLVAIGVIGVVIAITLPALSGAGAAAKKTRSLADLRQIGVSIELYLGAYRDTHPYQPGHLPYLVGPPDEPSGTVSDNRAPWSLSYAWPVLFHSVAPWREHYATWRGHPSDMGSVPWKSEAGGWTGPAYHYSNSFIGSPQTWMDQGDARDRATRRHEVRFPSQKVIMFDRFTPYHTGPEPADARGVLLADSSARVNKDADATPPVPNRTGIGFEGIYHNTPAGLQGSDL